MKTKYIATFEMRYNKLDRDNDKGFFCHKILIGIYDTFIDACDDCNKYLELLGSKFPKNKKNAGHGDRFSLNGGPFGARKDLIVNYGFSLPFEFYFKIEEHKESDFMTEINKAIFDIKHCREHQNRLNENN